MSQNTKDKAKGAFLPNHILLRQQSSLPVEKKESNITQHGFQRTIVKANPLIDVLSERNEVVLPKPPNYKNLHCRSYFDQNGKNPKLLFAFLIGVQAHDLNLGFQFSLQRPPFSNKRREFKPTSKILQQEVVRRATLSGTDRIPRPAQWSTDKLHEALVIRFPPQLNHDDKKFLKEKCISIYTETCKRISDEIKAEKELSSQIPLLHGKQGKLKALIRLYHTIVHFHSEFVVRYRNGTRKHARDKQFWNHVAEKYNDANFTPTSLVLPRLPGFEQSFLLPLVTRGLNKEQLIIMFNDVKVSLRNLVLEWNESYKPAPIFEEDGIIEQWDYKDFISLCLFQTHSFVLYLWELANKKKILGSCIFEGLEEELIRDNSILGPTLKKKIDVAIAVNSRRDNEREPIQFSVQETTKNNAYLDNHIKRERKMEQFLKIQELHLHHLQLQNTIENELLVLEEKIIKKKKSTEGTLYESFRDRKEASLKTMKFHTELCSKQVVQYSEELSFGSSSNDENGRMIECSGCDEDRSEAQQQKIKKFSGQKNSTLNSRGNDEVEEQSQSSANETDDESCEELIKRETTKSDDMKRKYSKGATSEVVEECPRKRRRVNENQQSPSSRRSSRLTLSKDTAGTRKSQRVSKS